MMTDSQADAIVEAMFKWLGDTTVKGKPGVFTIAAMIVDIAADATCLPLFDAYAGAKGKRGI